MPGVVAGSPKRADPYPREGSPSPDVCCELRHVGKAGAILVAVVNHGEGLGPAYRRDRRHQVRVAQNAVGGVLAIRVIPIVASVNYSGREVAPFRRNRGSLDHPAAENFRSYECTFSSISGVLDDGRHLNFSISEPNPIASVAHIKPERDAGWVNLPEGKRSGASLHSQTRSSLIQMKQGVPGQSTLGL